MAVEHASFTDISSQRVVSSQTGFRLPLEATRIPYSYPYLPLETLRLWAIRHQHCPLNSAQLPRASFPNLSFSESIMRHWPPSRS